MPKRKAPYAADSKLSVSSLDAAFDILANETFSRLDNLVKKFETATCMRLNEGVAKARWEEACKRYWVTRAMEDLCCGLQPSTSQVRPQPMETEPVDAHEEGRPLPLSIHPGPVVRHRMSAGEELEWRKWTPRVGDLVLVDLSSDQLWPGKIIDRRVFFQGRTAPRGNHFFPVRIYSEEIEASVSVKSRMIPLDLRPDPPLLASTAVLNAFNHARHPSSFDRAAESREQCAAQERTHPGVHGQDASDRIKTSKEAWNEHVNWVMNERRVEKLRNLNEEREKKLRAVAKAPDPVETEDTTDSRKRNCRNGVDRSDRDPAGIFALPAEATPPRSLTGSPLFRPVSQSTVRPMSPRRLEKRRNGLHVGMGEYSPRGRGSTYTPPRILPSGDETAPTVQSTSPSPVPSSLRFDFVSPLGPVRKGTLEERPDPRRSGSLGGHTLEAVEEEVLEDEGEGEWQVVQRRSDRRNSAPSLEAPTKSVEFEIPY